jgi:hypothetical protein
MGREEVRLEIREAESGCHWVFTSRPSGLDTKYWGTHAHSETGHTVENEGREKDIFLSATSAGPVRQN